MTGKEFLKLLDEFTERLKEYIETRERFVEKLTNELCAYIKEHYPRKKPVQIPDKLKSETKWCAIFAFESFEHVMKYQSKNKPYQPRHNFSIVTSKEESEKELQEFLRQIPEKHHEYAIKMHWEDYEEKRVIQLFHKGLHNKIKEVLVDFFEDDILEMKSEYLRQLDEYTYLSALCPFIQEIFKHLD